MSKKKAALLAEVNFIASKADAEGRDFTNAEADRVEQIKAEVERIDRGADTRATIAKAFGDDSRSGSNADELPPGYRGDGPMLHPLLGVAEESKTTKAIMRAINSRPGGFKAVTVTAGSISVPANLGIVPLARNPFLLQNLVQTIPLDTPQPGLSDPADVGAGNEPQRLGQATANGPDSISYLQQTGRTLAAAAVPRGGQKPESALAFVRKHQAFATLAHVVTVPNQWLQDSQQFAQVVQAEMLYGLSLAIDNLLLNDTTDEDGGTLRGLLTTTGLLATPFATDSVLTVRRGVGQLQNLGIEATGIAMSPTAWETIETTRIADESYLLPGAPSGSAERRLWNAPVTLVPGLADDAAIVGDFSTASIALIARGPITLQWNPYSKDATNESVLRVEGRFTPAIVRPGAFTIADLSAAV